MEEFNAHNWIEAQTLMREVKRKYSYSKYARLAELRIADADFEQEKFADAIREYKDFIHAHRSDDRGRRLRARRRSPRRRTPRSPSRSSCRRPRSATRPRSSTPTRSCGASSTTTRTPSRRRTSRELLANVTARLVRHELYVARFYLKKDNYEAAVARIQYALKNYGDGRLGDRRPAADSGARRPRRCCSSGTTYLQDAQVGRRPAGVRGHRPARYAQSPLAAEARNYLVLLQQQGV